MRVLAFLGAIFDVDGVLQLMAGRPRMAGARAALEHFGVPDVGPRAGRSLRAATTPG